MAFEFETPLILRLRKALGSGLTLTTSLFFLLTAALFGLYIYLFTDSSKALPILAVILAAVCFLAFLTGLITFVSARRREKMLSAAGANFGIFSSLVSLLALIGSYIFFMNESAFFEPIRNILAFFGIHDGVVRLFGSEIFFSVGFFLALFALLFFLSVRKTILNNRPHSALSILLAIYLLAVVIGFVFLAVYFFITSGIKAFSASFINVYYIIVALSVLITLFLTALCGIKYFTSCGGKR